MPRLLFVLLLLALAIVVLADQPVKTEATPDSSRYYSAIGTSDVIVLGLIKTAKAPEVPKSIQSATRTVGEFSFEVERTLKGTGIPTTFAFTCPLKLYVSNSGTDAKPVYNIHGWAPDISQGQKVILFLQRTPSGYTITPGSFKETSSQSFVAATEEDQVKAAVQSFALQISLTPPAHLIAFNTKAGMKITVKNTAKQTVQITAVSGEGQYFSTKIEQNLQITALDLSPSFTDENGKTQLIVVKPGEETVLTLTFAVGTPQSWKLFDPSSYLMTPATLRASLTYALLDDKGKSGASMQASSPQQNVVVGFPVPSL